MIIPKAKASIDGICQITRADLDHPNKNRYQEKKRQFFNQINGESDRATKEQNQGDKIGWTMQLKDTTQVSQSNPAKRKDKLKKKGKQWK